MFIKIVLAAMNAAFPSHLDLLVMHPLLHLIFSF